MTRVLIFSVAYEPHVGGAELAVRNITDRLSDIEFDLITARFSKRDPKQERVGNVNVYRVGFGNRLGRYLYPLLASRLAKRLHRKKKYQIVWSIMAAYAGAASLMFLNRFPKVSFLLTLQEGDSVEHIHKRVRKFKSAWKEIFRKADYIQTISKFLSVWARSEGAVCPVEVVPNGVDIGKFKNQKSKIKNLDQKTKIIITTSRLVPKNGVEILIRAISKLKALNQDTKYKVQILGSGPEEQSLKKLANKLGVDDVVEFKGHIENDLLPRYLTEADIFVRPSRSEGLGISFLEAMAVGLPVIATKVGGIPDFIIDGETGLFSKVDDPDDLAKKITLLATDSKFAAELSENGRGLIERSYDWEIVSDRMGEIFRKLV